jgi:hypothetical protein
VTPFCLQVVLVVDVLPVFVWPTMRTVKQVFWSYRCGNDWWAVVGYIASYLPELPTTRTAPASSLLCTCGYSSSPKKQRDDHGEAMPTSTLVLNSAAPDPTATNLMANTPSSTARSDW